MKLNRSIFSAIPVQEWNKYIHMPFPADWSDAVADIQYSAIERLVWTCNFVVCAELHRGGEIDKVREDIRPNAILISTSTDLNTVIKNPAATSARIASCGCCIVLTLKKE